MLGLSHNGVINLRLCFENKFSHFFLPTTVNRWIQKRIQNSKRAGPLADFFCLLIFEKNSEEHWSWNNQGCETKTTYTVVFSALLYLRNLSASPCGICWVFIIFTWRRVSRYKKCKGNENDARTQGYSDGNERDNLLFKKLKTLRSETDYPARDYCCLIVLSSNNIWVLHGKFNRY